MVNIFRFFLNFKKKSIIYLLKIKIILDTKFHKNYQQRIPLQNRKKFKKTKSNHKNF